MTQRKKINKIIILGGGTAGWLAAGYLSSQLPGIKIQVIESDQINIIGVGETTVPQFRTHLEKMGMDETQWMKASGSTYKYGARFTNWRNGNDERYHGFGDFLTEKVISRSTGEWFKKTPFFERDSSLDSDYWFKLLKSNKIQQDQIHWFNAEAYHLISNNLAHRDFNGHQFMSRCPGYAYNINAFQVGRAVRDLVATPNGVEHVLAHIDRVEHADDDSVECLVDRNGHRYHADLFLDCTGFKRLLIGKYSKWISYEERLGCKNVIGGRVAYEDDQEQWCTPDLHTTALSSGWSWKVALRDDMGSGYVFDKRFIDPDQAEQEIIEHWRKKGKELDVKVRLEFNNGILDKSAFRNVIAVGLASNFLEPLEATSISFTTLANELICDIINRHDGHWGYRDADVLSRLMRREIEYTVDFIWMHYALTERTDTEFWRHYGKDKEQAKQICYDWYNDDVDIYRREKDFDHTRYNKFDWAQMITTQHVWDDCPIRPINNNLLDRAKMLYQFRDQMAQSIKPLVPSHWQLIKHINQIG